MSTVTTYTVYCFIGIRLKETVVNNNNNNNKVNRNHSKLR